MKRDRVIMICASIFFLLCIGVGGFIVGRYFGIKQGYNLSVVEIDNLEYDLYRANLSVTNLTEEKRQFIREVDSLTTELENVKNDRDATYALGLLGWMF